MQTAYGELLLDWLLRGDTLTPPASWYFGLDVSLTGDAYTEPTYVGYARVAVARSTASWASAVGAGQIVTSVDVVWPEVPAGYTADEQVRRLFISDSATASGEHLLTYIELAAGADLAVGSEPTLAAGTLPIDAGD